MISIAIIHSDTFFIEHADDPIFRLCVMWTRWKKKYQKTCAEVDQTNPETIARRMQAWHCYCAIVSILREQNQYDEEEQQPLRMSEVEWGKDDD